MLAAGVIAEFNPFHKGHEAHLRETREITGRKIVAVMSGNFVQRGEPALCDKFRRTRMALACGADIVIELPVAYVISGADYFARGSVGLLAATGIVDALSFGSECGDLTALKEAGRVLAEEPPAYKKSLRAGLDKGLSFAAARGAALACCLESVPGGLLTAPNNGLAMEYCKALRLIGNPMEIFTTHRTAGGPSATKIRKLHLARKLRQMGRLTENECVKRFMPEPAHEILLEAGDETACLDDFSHIIRYLIYSGSDGLGEGLENRFRRLAGDFRLISDLLAAVKTKRYTFTRLQRAVLQMMLGIGAADMAFFERGGGVCYIRVLGFRRESAGLLSEMTKKAALPVIVNGKDIDAVLASGGAAAKMLEKDLEAGDIYRLGTGAAGGFRSERGVGVVCM